MSLAKQGLIVGILILLVWLVSLLSSVLMPLSISALLAYLGDPLIDRLEKMRLSRTAAVIIFFALVLLCGTILLVTILPYAHTQLSGLMLRLPQFISWGQENILPYLVTLFGFQPDSAYLDVIKQFFNQHASSVSGVTSHLLRGLNYSGQLFFTWLAYLVLIPVVTFYLLRDWDVLIAKACDLIPRSSVQLITHLARQCDAVLAEFLRGQLLLMLVLAALYSIGLWIVGLEFSLLIGLLTGLLSFVPYLGLMIGAAIAGIVGFMQFHDFIHLLYIAIVFGVVQLAEGLLLSPMLVGDRIGLHPVTVIFVVMAGGQLFGFIGILLALPGAAVLLILLRYVLQRYLQSDFYAS